MLFYVRERERGGDQGGRKPGGLSGGRGCDLHDDQAGVCRLNLKGGRGGELGGVVVA